MSSPTPPIPTICVRVTFEEHARLTDLAMRAVDFRGIESAIDLVLGEDVRARLKGEVAAFVRVQKRPTTIDARFFRPRSN